MSSKKNEKKGAIWMYAVILFTSAFIVLLLTAYSQIKFNKNIDDYKNKISSGEKEKINAQMSLNSAIDNNNKMKVELDGLKAKINTQENKQVEISKELQAEKNRNIEIIASYESLIAASEEYDRGNVIECAMILKKKCNYALLQKEAMEKYTYLSEKSFRDAAYRLYIQGYTSFKDKQYGEAIEKLRQSLELRQNEYFSDDSLYYIAYSQYYMGDKAGAKTSAARLLEQYPDSSYSQDVLIFIK